jgi:hypothetical protein
LFVIYLLAKQARQSETISRIYKITVVGAYKTSYLRIPDFSLILWTPGNRSLSGIGEFTGLSTHYKILEK